MSNKHTRDSDRERPFTPKPPQHMDPSKPPVKDKNSNARAKDGKHPATYDEVETERKSKPKQLGEADTEIDDETTI